MAMSIVGGLVKIGRGVVKIVKGTATGDGEEVVKGVAKVVRGAARTAAGALAGSVYEGGEVADEADEEV